MAPNLSPVLLLLLDSTRCPEECTIRRGHRFVEGSYEHLACVDVCGAMCFPFLAPLFFFFFGRVGVSSSLIRKYGSHRNVIHHLMSK